MSYCRWCLYQRLFYLKSNFSIHLKVYVQNTLYSVLYLIFLWSNFVFRFRIGKLNIHKTKMEFKNEELIDREIEIGQYLVQGYSLHKISEITRLNKKILSAHIDNMKEKLKTTDTSKLIKLLKTRV